MIDYEYEHRMHDRQYKKHDDEEIDLNKEYAEESKRVWKFFADRCIFLSK